MAIYMCWFLVFLLHTPSNHCLPTDFAAKSLARFSDLLLPLEEAPLEIVGADDTEAALGIADTDDDAIDKMFASYEKQFLHDLKQQPINLPLSFIRGGAEHNIRSRDTVGQVSVDGEEGSGSDQLPAADQQVVAIVQKIVSDGAATTLTGNGQQRAIDAADDLVANVYIGADNAERNRQQHTAFSFGLGSRWADLMAHTDRPVTQGIVMEEPPMHVAVDVSELSSSVANEGNARHGRQLFHSANITDIPQEVRNASAANLLETSIELIDAVPAEESFVAAPKAEPVATRSELLHDESLVPSVRDAVRNADTLNANEVHIIDENQKEAAEMRKANASKTILATLADANLLTNSNDGLAPIVPPQKPLKMAQAVGNAQSVEGSGDDVDTDIANIAKVVAGVVDDSMESGADAGKSVMIINTLNDSSESSEDDSNTAAENHDSESSRSHKNDSASDSDDDDDGDNDDDDDSNDDDRKKTSSVVSDTSDILRAIVEAVDLSKDIDSSIQSFRETADENSAVRQTRSETVAVATADSLAAASVDSNDRLAEATSTSDAARSRQMHLVSALVGYGAMVASLSVTLAIGVWFVYRRVHEARHVLIIANV